MTYSEIEKTFRDLKIDNYKKGENTQPGYQSPYFEKCTILKDTPITYSCSTTLNRE